MKTTLPARLKSVTVAILAAGLLAGCASSGNPKDPIEGFNRAMFAFNEGLDSAIVKPVATGYEAVLPSPVRTGVTNFFSNIEDVFIGVNNLLQGKVPEAFSDLGRVVINSTVGILGLIDFASDAGLEKHNEDFGQTFGRWGVGNGAYVVIPLFGPRTARDTVGFVLDVAADPVANHNPRRTRDLALVLRLVNDRANLLPADKVIEEAALDKYSYVRDGYLQRRRNLIHDGNAPREPDPSADFSAERSPTADAGAMEPRAESTSAEPVPAVLVARTEQVESK
ncbi:MAG: VacJ family lipoprotein [Sulfuritalea sp.]|jgi:phospholipid-binding lipoprotein MlaA|nr:VacJ family lipoprotein [Sulfuritalea sp.]MDP1984053.1 VacJ family lipoprotein [Sulfuritalea sp.]